MPALEDDRLVFRFPDHADSEQFSISFQRTLRIPDSDKTYPLPPGLGRLPIRHTEDHAGVLSASTATRGGVILPMWQAEAMWLNFCARAHGWGTDFPVAIKVAAGKINAVSGDAWQQGLRVSPQNYMVAPPQPWLDGFAIEPGVIRQFVAMPLSDNFTVEGQLTGTEEWGGLQIEVVPLKVDVWNEMLRRRELDRSDLSQDMPDGPPICLYAPPPEMGLSAGGRMRQEIYKDRFGLDSWDMSKAERVFVSLIHAKDWKTITGQDVPNVPPTAQDYAAAGLPWFDYYGGDAPVLPGSPKLESVPSLGNLYKAKTGGELPHSGDVETGPPKTIKAVVRRRLQSRF